MSADLAALRSYVTADGKAGGARQVRSNGRSLPNLFWFEAAQTGGEGETVLLRCFPAPITTNCALLRSGRPIINPHPRAPAPIPL